MIVNNKEAGLSKCLFSEKNFFVGGIDFWIDIFYLKIIDNNMTDAFDASFVGTNNRFLFIFQRTSGLASWFRHADTW